MKVCLLPYDRIAQRVGIAREASVPRSFFVDSGSFSRIYCQQDSPLGYYRHFGILQCRPIWASCEQVFDEILQRGGEWLNSRTTAQILQWQLGLPRVPG